MAPGKTNIQASTTSDSPYLQSNYNKPVKETEKPESEGYRHHKWGRQVVGSILEIPPSLMNARGDYQVYYKEYLKDPQSKRFTKFSKKLYRNDNILGRIMKKANLPNETRNGNTKQIVKKLNSRGYKLGVYGKGGDGIVRAARLLINIQAINMCYEQGCSHKEWASIGSDTSGNISDMSAYIFNAVGRHGHLNGKFADARHFLKMSHRLFRLSGVLQVISGMVRVYTEYDHYKQTGDANTSTAFYAVSDMSVGMYMYGRSAYIMKQVGIREVMSRLNGVPENQLVGKVSRMLALGDVVWSPRITKFLWGTGISAAGIGLVINSATLVDNIWFQEDLDEHTRQKNIATSIAGLVICGVIGASVIIVSSPGYPLSLTIFAVSLVPMAIHGMYDSRDQLTDDDGISIWRNANGERIPKKDTPECVRLEQTGIPFQYECTSQEEIDFAKKSIKRYELILEDVAQNMVEQYVEERSIEEQRVIWLDQNLDEVPEDKAPHCTKFKQGSNPFRFECVE